MTCGPTVVERQLGKQAGGALLGAYRGPACEGRAGVEWLEGYPAEGGPAGGVELQVYAAV